MKQRHQVMNYRDNDGCKLILLVTEGTTRLHYLMFTGNGMVARTCPKSEERNMVQVEYHGKPYPYSRAVRHFRRYRKLRDTTKAALKLLGA